MKYILWLIRIVVGVLFIFSGLVKANDPMGLVYKMNEFFDVLHMSFMSSYSFAFSILMIAFEIIAGIALLLGYAFRVFSVLLLLLNVFYMFLTGYALYSGKVQECGCFGACIKISNDATFWKDVVLTALSIILFVYRKRILPLFTAYPGASLMIICSFFAFGIQWWALEHGPFVDCLAYKPGNNLWQKMHPATGPGIVPDRYESVMVYEKNGIKKEFQTNSPEKPWEDSTWKYDTTINKLIKGTGNAEPEIKDFTLVDIYKNDHTQEILTTPGYMFLWFVKDPEKMRQDNMDRLQNIIKRSQKLGVHFYLVISGTAEQDTVFQRKWNVMGVDMVLLDATVAKTAMRTNPGLMLLKDGTVQQKWSFRDYPKDINMENDKLTTK